MQMPDFKDTPDPRHVLPKRRPSETLKVTNLDGQAIHLTIGYDPADPERPREVFYSAGFKSGSQIEFQIQDACVMFSLLLQHGLRVDEIAKSLSRTEQADGSMTYASVIGLIANSLIAE